MIKMECSACGASLREEGKFWVCDHCRTRFALGRDDEGQPFTYIPVEKKEITCGQIGVKASALTVNTVVVREIKLKDTVEVDIHNESMNLDTAESIRLVKTYVQAEEWEAAQTQINRLLLEDVHGAEVQWYGLLCNKPMADEAKFVEAWTDFAFADQKKLDDILANSSPKFAGHLLDLVFAHGYASDEACARMLETVLPYAVNEAVYTADVLKKRIDQAFEATIAKSFDKAFLFLLTHTLDSDEVDTYLKRLFAFAKICPPERRRTYYRMILDVDPGNVEAHRKIVRTDVLLNAEAAQCVNDLEGLLQYSECPDAEIDGLIEEVLQESDVTVYQSEWFRTLLQYHSKAPNGLQKEITEFAFLLLNHALWDEARKYLNLLLSLDARNPEAYWGLCLARIQAKNEDEVQYTREKLVDCPEFSKCLALYQSANNTKKAEELMGYTKQQKDLTAAKQRLKKIGCIVAAIVLLVVGWIWFDNHRKYSLSNVSIAVTKKQNFDDSMYVDNLLSKFTLEVQNKSSHKIIQIQGDLKIRTAKAELAHVTATLELDLEAGETTTTVLKFDSGVIDAMQPLYDAKLEELDITFCITSIIYEGYHGKDYENADVMLIHKATETASSKEEDTPKEETPQEEPDPLTAQYTAAMEAYDKVDVTGNTFQADMDAVADALDEIWTDVTASDALLRDLYGRAAAYKQQTEYEKAYYLFALLSTVAYEDSEQQALECYQSVQ